MGKQSPPPGGSRLLPALLKHFRSLKQNVACARPLGGKKQGLESIKIPAAAAAIPKSGLGNTLGSYLTGNYAAALGEIGLGSHRSRPSNCPDFLNCASSSSISSGSVVVEPNEELWRLYKTSTTASFSSAPLFSTSVETAVLPEATMEADSASTSAETPTLEPNDPAVDELLVETQTMEASEAALPTVASTTAPPSTAPSSLLVRADSDVAETEEQAAINENAELSSSSVPPVRAPLAPVDLNSRTAAAAAASIAIKNEAQTSSTPAVEVLIGTAEEGSIISEQNMLVPIHAAAADLPEEVLPSAGEITPKEAEAEANTPPSEFCLDFDDKEEAPVIPDNRIKICEETARLQDLIQDLPEKVQWLFSRHNTLSEALVDARLVELMGNDDHWYLNPQTVLGVLYKNAPMDGDDEKIKLQKEANVRLIRSVCLAHVGAVSELEDAIKVLCVYSPEIDPSVASILGQAARDLWSLCLTCNFSWMLCGCILGFKCPELFDSLIWWAKIPDGHISVVPHFGVLYGNNLDGIQALTELLGNGTLTECHVVQLVLDQMAAAGVALGG